MAHHEKFGGALEENDDDHQRRCVLLGIQLQGERQQDDCDDDKSKERFHNPLDSAVNAAD
ncbi:hypothetical protein [Arthrobacter sp. UYCu723]